MGFMDKLKQKAEEYDLQGKADKLAQQIEKGTQQAVEKAGEYAHENRDKIATGIDKAGAKFDEQTQGKYSDKVAKAKDLAAKGVDKVAEQRTGAAGAAGTPEGTSAYGASEPGPQDATPQDAVHPPTYGASSPTTPTAPTTGTPGTTPTPSAGATPPPGPADPSI